MFWCPCLLILLNNFFSYYASYICACLQFLTGCQLWILCWGMWIFFFFFNSSRYFLSFVLRRSWIKLLGTVFSLHASMLWVCVCSVMSFSSQPHGLQPVRLLCSWHFPGKNTGVGCYFFLLRIFLTQGSNPCLLHSVLRR